MIEILDVIGRCKECGMATSVMLREQGLSDDGSEYVAYRGEKVPHGGDACARFSALQREQWPTLW